MPLERLLQPAALSGYRLLQLMAVLAGTPQQLAALPDQGLLKGAAENAAGLLPLEALPTESLRQLAAPPAETLEQLLMPSAGTCQKLPAWLHRCWRRTLKLLRQQVLQLAAEAVLLQPPACWQYHPPLPAAMARWQLPLPLSLRLQGLWRPRCCRHSLP